MALSIGAVVGSARGAQYVASKSRRDVTLSRVSVSQTCACFTRGARLRTSGQRFPVCNAGSQEESSTTDVAPRSKRFALVRDVMTGGKVVCCTPDATVDEALELLVENRITGLPVVDEQNYVAFKEVKSLLAKTGGKRVKDVMTNKPITVTPGCDLDVAARILLSKKIRRLPVIDEDGKLCGIISRSNIVKAALVLRKAVP